MGYNHFGPQTEKEFITKLDRLRERMEYLDGIMIIQSLAGGTGSGLGSYLTKSIK